METPATKVVVSNCIVRLRNLAAMRLAVDFDDQSGMQAREVDDVSSDLLLLAEMEAVSAEREQQTPEAALWGRRLKTEFLRQGSGAGASCAPLPSPPR